MDELRRRWAQPWTSCAQNYEDERTIGVCFSLCYQLMQLGHDVGVAFRRLRRRRLELRQLVLRVLGWPSGRSYSSKREVP